MTTRKNTVAGSPLPSMTRTPTSRQLVQYAAASRDFYEIHYDQVRAEAAGYPTVIVHGLLKMAWLGQFIEGWAGTDSYIRRIMCSYRGVDKVNEAYTLGGAVTGVMPIGNNLSLVELEIWGQNEEGFRTTVGTASVEVPNSELLT